LRESLLLREEALIRIVVKVASGLLESGQPLPPDVQAAASPYVLEPLHPGSEEPSLASWYEVAVEDPAEAEDVAARLRSLPRIEAAYVEPPSGPPG
jgi:hypothetical protein